MPSRCRRDGQARRFHTRQFATMADAIVLAMKEAIERRDREIPAETAARLWKKHGISLKASDHKPLPHDVFGAM
ncbi:hypothetical protein G6M05_27265 [Agrobacterium tumefaciens]|nr:hypothetical protein [Agrobacterium tumefaciens]